MNTTAIFKHKGRFVKIRPSTPKGHVEDIATGKVYKAKLKPIIIYDTLRGINDT